MKARVLVIDDDASVRASLQKVLAADGYEVTTAADAPEGLERFSPDKIDLVLLDLNLPSRSGWDVFERLTTDHPTLPLIIITGLSNQFFTAAAAGVGALMEKPIDAPALLKTMDELLTEPPAARLRRMTGYQQDTRHLAASPPAGQGNAPRVSERPGGRRVTRRADAPARNQRSSPA
jgi:DNA-binding NtrC family response regulator